MKKYMLLLIVVFAALLAAGCSNLNTSKTDLDTSWVDLDRILVVDDGQHYSESEFNYGKMISDEIQHSIDESAQVDKSLVLNGAERSLKYKDTLFYPIGDKYVHRYFVDGNEENTVLIDSEGAVQAILYDYTVLDITQTASPAEVLALLKLELSKITDISFYENMKIPEHAPEEKGFGVYDFLFFNQKNGYMTDYLIVSVFDDGRVLGLKINNLPETSFNLDIDHEKEKQAIECKMKEIFDTEDRQYKSYALHFDPCITIYEGEIYIEYSVSAKYVYAQGGEMSSFINIILIPLSLISN